MNADWIAASCDEVYMAFIREKLRKKVRPNLTNALVSFFQETKMKRFLSTCAPASGYFVLSGLYVAYQCGVDSDVIIPSVAVVYSAMGIAKLTKS